MLKQLFKIQPLRGSKLKTSLCSRGSCVGARLGMGGGEGGPGGANTLQPIYYTVLPCTKKKNNGLKYLLDPYN